VVDTVKAGTGAFDVGIIGEKAYVTNLGENTVSVIDITSDKVVDTIKNVGATPLGIAIDPANQKA